MTRETWKPVVRFPDYEVSDQGRVRRARRGSNGAPLKILKSWKGAGGELYVALRRDGTTHRLRISVVQELAFAHPEVVA